MSCSISGGMRVAFGVGVLAAVAAGCGTEVDTRLRVNGTLRQACSGHTDQEIKTFINVAEDDRLNGIKAGDAESDVAKECDDAGAGVVALVCDECAEAVVAQVYGP